MSYGRSSFGAASFGDYADAGVADTTAPILSLPTATAVTSSTATGGVTTDEAGPAWAVLSTSATKPTPAQIKAGQNHLGAAVPAATATLVVGSNPSAFSFSGATGGETYFMHVVQDDAASPVNTTPTAATSASITTPVADGINPVLTGAITVGAKTSSTIAYSFPAGTDNVGITAYDVRVDGGAWVPIGASPSGSLTGRTALTSYLIEVSARDAAGLRSNILSVTTSTYRAGATGQDIIDLTGPVDGNQPGILFNDVVLPGDANKWFSFRLITSPSAGVFDIDALGRFTLTGVASTSFTYQLEVDGVDIGIDGLPGTYAVPVTIYDTTIYRPTGDVTITGWTSTGANLFGVIDEVAPDDGDFITSPGLSGSPGPAVLSFTTPLPAGNYTWRVRAQRLGASGDIRVVLQDGAGASVGASAWQTVTGSFALYELPVTASAPASRAALEVRP